MSLWQRRTQVGDRGRPLIRYSDPLSPVAIAVLAGSIIAIVVAAAAYLFFRAYRDNTIATSATTSTPSAGPAFVSVSLVNDGISRLCPAGECATNVFTGSKRCPESFEVPVAASLPLEVCNPRFSCSDPATPYAINSDSSTNANGLCENDPLGNPIACRCQRYASCPVYIRSVFSTYAGNPYDSLDTQRVMLRQTTATLGAGGELSLPMTITDPANQFCTIPQPWLARAVPGACLRGTAAYIVPDVENFDPDAANVGCVDGSPCPTGQLAVWDVKIDQLRCIPDTRTVSATVVAGGLAWQVSYRSITSNVGQYAVRLRAPGTIVGGVVTLPGVVLLSHRPSNSTTVAIIPNQGPVTVTNSGNVLLTLTPGPLASLSVSFKVANI